jgi:hypothetical protein
MQYVEDGVDHAELAARDREEAQALFDGVDTLGGALEGVDYSFAAHS